MGFGWVTFLNTICVFEHLLTGASPFAEDNVNNKSVISNGHHNVMQWFR